MDFTTQYLELIEQLKQGKRPFRARTKEEFSQLELLLGEALDSNSSDDIHKILCILEHAGKPGIDLSSIFSQIILSSLETNIIVCALGVSHTQVIDAHFLKGIPIPSIFTQALKEKLSDPRAEVVEWSLRTIEYLGPQARVLKNEIQNFPIKFTYMFNKHSRQFTSLLEYISANIK
ncbi:MAG: hypothetical protein HOE90_16180 [Bacteriovoracaceae bacterium]|jgi:hypothetical protein|nr:hypothetical protein [Bacteriovoracaceae bacterium]